MKMFSKSLVWATVCLGSLVLSFAAKAQITDRVPKNVARTGELAQDPSAILFIVDGVVWMSLDFTYEKLGSIEIEEVLDCFVEAFPFISKEDIAFIKLIKSNEWSEHGIFFQIPKYTFLITTKKESRIKTFVLNGKSKKRHCGIELGLLLDEELLKQHIQKKWRIKSNTITGLTIDGKTIIITTM